MYDDFLNLKKTIKDVKDFKLNTKKLSQHYEAINSLLHKELSLEESLFFMDLPHKVYLYNLVKTAQNHEKIVRNLGLQFVDIVKQAKSKRKQK